MEDIYTWDIFFFFFPHYTWDYYQHSGWLNQNKVKRCDGRAWMVDHGWSSSGIGKKKAAYPPSLWCSSPGTAVHPRAIKRRADFNVKIPNWFWWIIVKKIGFKEASGHISGSASFVPMLVWHPHSWGQLHNSVVPCVAGYWAQQNMLWARASSSRATMLNLSIGFLYSNLSHYRGMQ